MEIYSNTKRWFSHLCRVHRKIGWTRKRI